MNKSWQINRRTMLRGMGAALALPWLEGMSWAADAAKPKARMCAFFFHYGVPMPPDDHPLRQKFGYFPVGEGADFQFTGTHASLEKFRHQLTYFGGLSHPLGRRVPGHKAGDVYLTGADISGSAYRQSISVDQVAANAIGHETRFASLIMSTTGGVNRPYRSTTLSYDRDGRAIPALNSPREIFRRLFGQVSGDERQRLQNRASVLDAILGEAKSLDRKLGKRDQQKMDEYLTSVRDVEQRVDRAQEWLDVPKPKVDGDSLSLEVDPSTPREYLRTMFDLLVLALQTDSTRVGTFQLAAENGAGGESQYPLAVGISKSAHAVSHQRTDYEQWSKYQAFFAEQYAYFLDKMNSVEDVAGANLLDQTMTLYGSATSQTHVSRNYPLVLAGGGNLGIQHGQYRKYDENKTPLANLFVTMLDRLGTNATSFKDSHGGLSELLRV